jgi:hypothetical protein
MSTLIVDWRHVSSGIQRLAGGLRRLGLARWACDVTSCLNDAKPCCVVLFVSLFSKNKKARLSPYKSLFPHLRLLSKGTPAANEQDGLP